MNVAADKTIYFVRHAKDDSRYRGGWSLRPLVRDGDIQARELANKIKNHAADMNIKTVISSDLPRAFQTAVPCAQMLGIPIIKSKGWRETNNGKLAGMLNREAQRRYPGGESPTEFYERIKREFSVLEESIINEIVESNVMVFTHSGVINILYSIICGGNWTNKRRSFDIPYTSVHAYKMGSGKIVRIL